MVILRVLLMALPEKRKELDQAVSFMMSRIRQETACGQIHAYHDMEDENRILVCSQWENRENLAAFLRSERFSALLGTKILLSNSPVAFVDTVAKSEGMEAVAALRSRSKEAQNRTSTPASS